MSGERWICASSRVIARSMRAAFSLVIVAVLLAGCGDGLFGDTRQTRIKQYEESVREEADWLWNNLNYARTNLWPNEEICTQEVFKHPTIQLTDSQREQSPNDAYMVDLLDQAAVLTQQGHTAWEEFCAGGVSAAETTRFLENHLIETYNRLNGVLWVMAPQQPTPRPGST